MSSILMDSVVCGLTYEGERMVWRRMYLEFCIPVIVQSLMGGLTVFLVCVFLTRLGVALQISCSLFEQHAGWGSRRNP